MIFPSNWVCIVIATKAFDFRRGHDRLAALVSPRGALSAIRSAPEFITFASTESRGRKPVLVARARIAMDRSRRIEPSARVAARKPAGGS